MTSLQLGLIIGGVALVVGVIIYNWYQERRVRRRMAAGSVKDGDGGRPPTTRNLRLEPTLARSGRGDDHVATPRRNYAAASGPQLQDGAEESADDFVAPIEVLHTQGNDLEAADTEHSIVAASPVGMSPLALKSTAGEKATQPDPDAECVVSLHPERPVGAAALAAGLQAKIGKPLRWLVRSGTGSPWHVLRADTPGQFNEIAACLLLADRAGPLTPPMMDRFLHLMRDIAASLPAPFVAPNGQGEVDRAEALDRLCGDLDVQIGLTVLKPSPGTIAGTRLRGVAEAAGFRLTDNGRFDWIQEETGCVLYSLQNYRAEPFTAESLRLTSTPGAVFILDVPRVSDPVRVFDQMKIAAKRMTTTLDAALVDDNRRPLDDAALASIREQVQATAAALKEIHVAPGSPRALKLFGG